MSRAGGALERPSNADAVAPQDATRSVDSRRPRLADATRNEPVGGFPNRDGIVRVSDAVKSLPIVWLRWLVLGVVVYAAFQMLRSVRRRPGNSAIHKQMTN
jgi:hypothetical protein